MTAMCDVAFLVLAFFILTAKPKQWLPVDVKLPVVKGDISEGGANVAVIIIAQDRVMFEIGDVNVRRRALSGMNADDHLGLSAEEVEKFEKISTIGVPAGGLKNYIDNYYNSDLFYSQPGINITPANNELGQWIFQGKKASNAVYGYDEWILIEADKRTPYPEIERVFNILQDQHILKFGLQYYGRTIKE